MFVVTGDERARLQFFRDIIHQKVNDQKLLEIYINTGSVQTMYINSASDSTFYNEWSRLPEGYNTNPTGWERLTNEGLRWRSFFTRRYSAGDIYCFELTERIYQDYPNDFKNSIMNSLRYSQENQFIVNSHVPYAHTRYFLSELEHESYRSERVPYFKCRYIDCLDKDDHYEYTVFQETFKRPYEKGA